jgi:hypothetical protein
MKTPPKLGGQKLTLVNLILTQLLMALSKSSPNYQKQIPKFSYISWF